MQDGLILIIAYIGILPFNKKLKSYEIFKNSNKDNLYKINFFEKITFIFVLFPLIFGLIQRSLGENYVLENSDKKVKEVSKITKCRNIGYSYESEARLFSIYDNNFASFFGWKPYNSLRRYLFIQYLVNPKHKFTYHHMQMFGKTENYNVNWLKLTGICAIIDENNKLIQVDSHKQRSIRYSQILFTQNPEESLRIMKERKDDILTKKVVVSERNLIKDSFPKNEMKSKTKISELGNPSTNIALFQNEYRQNFYGYVFIVKNKLKKLKLIAQI